MVISTKYKFVFFANTKTASTSIENVLCKYDDKKTLGYVQDKPNKKHVTYRELIQQYPFINEYTKFACVRNPFDWIVSWYSYKKRRVVNTSKGCTFENWLCDPKSSAYQPEGINLTLSQFDVVKNDKSKLAMDYICRFETLQEDFDNICNILKIPTCILPKRNASTHRPYKTYYSKSTRKFVEGKYSQDLINFNYTF